MIDDRRLAVEGENKLGIHESVWSSGMIPALGAGGPGFNPPNRPLQLVLLFPAMPPEADCCNS